jgi:sporulation related protein
MHRKRIASRWRTAFLALVAANVGLFAWTYALAPPDPALDPRPLANQIDPAQMRILSPAELAATPPPPKPAPSSCIEWGAFTLAVAPRAEQALEPLALGARLSSRRGEETAHWWVFIPPKDGKAGAQKAVNELKNSGFDDYHVMQEEGKMRWAVSLGVFGTEAAAQGRLDAVREKGVRGAQAGPRETVVTKVSLQVKQADAATRAKLAEIAQQFPGSELRECPAPG